MASASSLPGPLPSRDQELVLHRRLVDGDHTATSDLAATFLTPLIRWLQSHNGPRAQEFCDQAAGDALCALMKDPGAYVPGRGNDQGLFAYLRMSAQGDLKNFLQKEMRHHRSRRPWNSVEESSAAGKYLEREDDPSLPLSIREETDRIAAQVLPAVRDGLTDVEMRGLELLISGEKATSAFASVCGFDHLSAEQQRIEVKRLKDKLKQRLKRARPADEQ